MLFNPCDAVPPCNQCTALLLTPDASLPADRLNWSPAATDAAAVVQFRNFSTLQLQFVQLQWKKVQWCKMHHSSVQRGKLMQSAVEWHCRRVQWCASSKCSALQFWQFIGGPIGQLPGPRASWASLQCTLHCALCLLKIFHGNEKINFHPGGRDQFIKARGVPYFWRNRFNCSLDYWYCYCRQLLDSSQKLCFWVGGTRVGWGYK